MNLSTEECKPDVFWCDITCELTHLKVSHAQASPASPPTRLKSEEGWVGGGEARVHMFGL